MEFISADQTDPKTLNTLNFDLFIAAAGYEKRCTYLLEKYDIHAEKKIAIAFKEKFNELFRKRTNQILTSHGFLFYEISGNDHLALEDWLQQVFSQNGKKKLQILLDYSCMTKMWYSTIIHYFIREEKKFDHITIYFSYTPASFGSPKKVKAPKKAQSINIGTKEVDPGKPKALVIGLGYEKGRAEFLIKKVKPAIVYLMYADPAPDEKYVISVFKMNQDILTEVEPRNMINYPLNDLAKTNELLTNLCLDLRLRYNVILAPLGPKVHALNCILLATRYPDIDVWRISSGSNVSVYDRIAGSDPLVLKVVFNNEED